MLVMGVVLIVLGVMSRLFSLEVLRRISTSPSRDVIPSVIPGTPWFHVQSDRSVLTIVVAVTYGSIVLGMLLVLIGVV